MSGEMPDGDRRGREKIFQLKEENLNIFESSTQEKVLFLLSALVDLTKNLTWLRQGRGPSSHTIEEGYNLQCSLWIGEGDMNFY